MWIKYTTNKPKKKKTTDIGFLRRIFTDDDDNEWMKWNEMISMRTEKK